MKNEIVKNIINKLNVISENEDRLNTLEIIESIDTVVSYINYELLKEEVLETFYYFKYASQEKINQFENMTKSQFIIEYRYDNDVMKLIDDNFDELDNILFILRQYILENNLNERN